MDSRERVLRAIRFENPDKIPLSYGVTGQNLFHLGTRRQQQVFDLFRKYPNDFYDLDIIKVPERNAAHYRPDGSYYKEETDGWGSVWVFIREDEGSGQVKFPVMDDWSKLKNLKVPPVPNSSPDDRRRVKEEVKKQKEKYIGWGTGGSLFEQMQWLRGPANLLMDIATDCEEVYILADLIMKRFLIPMVELALETGVDVVGFGDDWGSQNQLLINPRSWRKIFKPRYKVLFDLVRQGGAFPWMHSDGMTMEIIPDWIETGLAVLNPQFACMDMVTIQKAAQGKLCINGDIDRQRTLPFGTPEQVREYIHKVTRVFGSPEGGFIYGLGLDNIPVENIEAAFQTIYEIRDLAIL